MAHPVYPVVKETLVLKCLYVFVTYPERCSCPCWRWGLGCGPCPCLWGWSCFRRTDSVSGTLGNEEARLSWVWLRGSMAVWILPPVSKKKKQTKQCLMDQSLYQNVTERSHINKSSVALVCGPAYNPLLQRIAYTLRSF